MSEWKEKKKIVMKKIMRSEFRPKVVSTEFDLLNRR